MTINLSPAASVALEELTKATGESQTLMISQALVAYAYLKRKARQGLLKIVEDDGHEVEIAFL